MDRYFGDWDCVEQVIDNFSMEASELSGAVVIAASYTYEDYSGSAMVVFRKDGKLYEVHGSHCSCNGLEGQWDPEETSYEALQYRLENGEMGSYFGPEFLSALQKGLIDEMFDREVLENV